MAPSEAAVRKREDEGMSRSVLRREEGRDV
jgi:hypothetical protein